jgi:phage-related minor tail protein
VLSREHRRSTPRSGEAAEFWKEQNDALNNGILDAIVNGENLADVFQDVARSIARAALEAALFGEGPLAGPNIGSGLLGNLFGGIFGRASGGPVQAGQPYVVGERRPELFVPSTSGRIQPTVPAGGGSVTVQVNNYSGQSVETKERRGPDGQRVLEVAVGRAIADGRFDRAMASRYGNTPQGVRR